MTLSKLSIVTYLSLLLVAVCAKTCTYDSQCGSTPYAVCSGGAEDCGFMYDGVAIGDGKVYYAEGCRAPDNADAVAGQKLNSTIKSVAINGGQITTLLSEQRQRSGNVGGVWAINGKNLFINRYNRYNTLKTFNVDNKKETVLLSKFYDALYITSDTYTCSFNSYASDDDYRKYFNISKYSGVLSSTSSAPKTVYTVLAGGCNSIFVSGSSIYFALEFYDYDNATELSTVYKGDINCKNCQPPAPLFTVKGTIGGITQDPSDSTKIFFGTESGLFSYTVAKNKITTLSSEATFGEIVFYQGSIYYNNDKFVRAYNVNTKSTKSINAKKTGVCKCAYGFTGEQCQICNGQIQWDSYNNPSCIKTDANGVPETCTQDFQCGSANTYCDGTCHCQPNFTGPKCDKCAGTVTVTDGVPTCTV